MKYLHLLLLHTDYKGVLTLSPCPWILTKLMFRIPYYSHSQSMGWGALVGPEYAALFQFEIMSSYINSFNYMNSELNPVIEGG